ncbi:MAG: universal stress protein [Rhodomicrobiaceae bacterium]
MYKTILAYLPSAESAGLLSEVGGYLAEKCRAHLIGAHNSARITLYGGIPSEYLAQHNQRQRQEADSIRQDFEKTVSARGVSHEWRHHAMKDTDAFADIVAAARTADLIVAGGKGQEDPLGRWYDLPIRLVLESGRPTLLIPADGKFATMGERITVAWNHTRESARAAFDALPLLKTASWVRILAVNSPHGGVKAPSEELATTLARHGVNVEPAVSNTTERSEGEELLGEVERTNSDMLVMGCYGHSRLRETVLGGATRYVLSHMSKPVLLSH